MTDEPTTSHANAELPTDAMIEAGVRAHGGPKGSTIGDQVGRIWRAMEAARAILKALSEQADGTG